MDKQRMANYSPSEVVKNGISLIYTKIFWRGARLIRLPVYVRGRKSIEFAGGLTLGYRCRLECNGEVQGKKLKIGGNCVIGDNAQIEANKGVHIGKNVLMASRVFISDTFHGNYSEEEQSSPQIPPNQRKLTFKAVKIGNNVWIGENVCVLPGAEIGDGAIVSANSVVTGKIPSNSIVGGVPARVLKRYEETSRKWEREKIDCN